MLARSDNCPTGKESAVSGKDKDGCIRLVGIEVSNAFNKCKVVLRPFV